jgi:hypothetical protein
MARCSHDPNVPCGTQNHGKQSGGFCRYCDKCNPCRHKGQCGTHNHTGSSGGYCNKCDICN